MPAFLEKNLLDCYETKLKGSSKALNIVHLAPLCDPTVPSIAAHRSFHVQMLSDRLMDLELKLRIIQVTEQSAQTAF